MKGYRALKPHFWQVTMSRVGGLLSWTALSSKKFFIIPLWASFFLALKLSDLAVTDFPPIISTFINYISSIGNCRIFSNASSSFFLDSNAIDIYFLMFQYKF